MHLNCQITYKWGFFWEYEKYLGLCSWNTRDFQLFDYNRGILRILLLYNIFNLLNNLKMNILLFVHSENKLILKEAYPIFAILTLFFFWDNTLELHLNVK